MSNLPPEDTTNWDVTRAKAVLLLIKEAWSTFGLPTIILVILFLLWIDVIASPLGNAKDTLDQLKATIDTHVEQDKEIIFYLKQTCLSTAKLAGESANECLWRPER